MVYLSSSPCLTDAASTSTTEAPRSTTAAPYSTATPLYSTRVPSRSTSRQVLGPLTTTFYPPHSCHVHWGPPAVASINLCGIFYRDQICAEDGLEDDTSCWPPAAVAPAQLPSQGWGVYSPGTVCPSGYVTACTAVKASNGSLSSSALDTSFNFQMSLQRGETAIGCCPPYARLVPSGTSAQS